MIEFKKFTGKETLDKHGFQVFKDKSIFLEASAASKDLENISKKVDNKDVFRTKLGDIKQIQNLHLNNTFEIFNRECAKLIGAKEFKVLLFSFLGAIFFSTVVSVFVYYFDSSKQFCDIRDISIFISHIRLSLLVCVAIFCLGYLLFQNNSLLKRILLALSIFWFVFFLYLIQSATGFSILLIASNYFFI